MQTLFFILAALSFVAALYLNYNEHITNVDADNLSERWVAELKVKEIALNRFMASIHFVMFAAFLIAGAYYK